MSWLGSLAAKTETLLNKVDQAAGQALQTPEKNSSYDSETLTKDSFFTTQPFSENIQHTSTLSTKSSNLRGSSSSSKLSKIDRKKDPDSELFAFLNDAQALVSSSSQSALTSNTVQSNDDSKKSSDEKQISPKSVEKPLDTTDTPNTNIGSDVLRENQLLKDEIQSLNRELISIASRGKSAQEEYNKLMARLEIERKQALKCESVIRDLREQEVDMNNAIQAKDAQLSVLRVRLEEADMNIKEKEKKIVLFQSEKDSILEDHCQSTGAQSQALDSLQVKLKELEEKLKSEEDKNKKLETESREMMTNMEQHKEQNVSEMAQLQKKITTEKGKISDLNSQIKLLRSQADMSRQELKQYKDKATRILQSKEKLISKLKENSSVVDGSGASEPMIQATEMEALRNERDVLRDELTSVQMSLDTVKAEYSDLEIQSEQEVEGLKEQISLLEDAVETEKRRKDDVDGQLASKTHELKYLHEELLGQKHQMQNKIAEREAEIQKLRNQLTTKSLNASSNEELEGRLHALTESLIQKQTHLEALSSEKHSLTLQLERLEKQQREQEKVALRHSSTGINIHNDDDDDAKSRYFMRESPFDGKVTRNVKKAANSIDRFSMRLGLFLRRYPFVRVFIIIYMFLLHLWVMVVLLTYQPEVHGPETFPHAL